MFLVFVIYLVWYEEREQPNIQTKILKLLISSGYPQVKYYHKIQNLFPQKKETEILHTISLQQIICDVFNRCGLAILSFHVDEISLKDKHGYNL